ncbi:hypothetical protein P171DRAFT_477335 [Karstenula rhodostoma CBS 690.94]|uniref:Uncharacterized protein n=1 Tax=Karstenula rhodostoma CBS 690.94 TaxID=1392251 RepID=A0A9P4P848_9PLEO|nr:hypothetical protein P171DRAFT_477335 [Karstenula rhodostoma CBS 690.94]
MKLRLSPSHSVFDRNMSQLNETKKIPHKERLCNIEEKGIDKEERCFPTEGLCNNQVHSKSSPQAEAIITQPCDALCEPAKKSRIPDSATSPRPSNPVDATETFKSCPAPADQSGTSLQRSDAMREPEHELETRPSADEHGKSIEDEDICSLFYWHEKVLELRLLNAHLKSERENDRKR